MHNSYVRYLGIKGYDVKSYTDQSPTKALNLLSYYYNTYID